MRYFKFAINGYGAEQYIAKITKEQCKYWQDMKKRYYDFEHEDPEADDIWESLNYDHFDHDGIPAYAKFNEESVHEWGDYVLQHWGGFLSSCNLYVYEVDGRDWGSRQIGPDVEYDLADPKINPLDENEEFGEVIFGEYDETYPLDMDHPVLYWVHSEKGTFFEGSVEIDGEFDPKKLQIVVEDIDGEYKISGLKYDGEEIDNEGGDTRSKSEDYYFFLND